MSEHEKTDSRSSLKSALKQGCFTILAFPTALLLVACLLPPIIFRANHGRGPISGWQYRQAWNAEGMTVDEVLQILGEPHDRVVEDDGSERWYYWGDSYGLGYVGLKIGPDRKVKHTWI